MRSRFARYQPPSKEGNIPEETGIDIRICMMNNDQSEMTTDLYSVPSQSMHGQALTAITPTECFVKSSYQ
jgi:hypothetical protein